MSSSLPLPLSSAADPSPNYRHCLRLTIHHHLRLTICPHVGSTVIRAHVPICTVPSLFAIALSNYFPSIPIDVAHPFKSQQIHSMRTCRTSPSYCPPRTPLIPITTVNFHRFISKIGPIFYPARAVHHLHSVLPPPCKLVPVTNSLSQSPVLSLHMHVKVLHVRYGLLIHYCYSSVYVPLASMCKSIFTHTQTSLAQPSASILFFFCIEFILY